MPKMHDTTATKICTKCKEEKPATTEYYCRQKGQRFGLNPVCKVCDKQRYRVEVQCPCCSKVRSVRMSNWRLRQSDYCRACKPSILAAPYLCDAVLATKICTRCKEKYLATAEHFGEDRRNPDGFNKLCKACVRKEAKVLLQCPACKEVRELWRSVYHKRKNDLCPRCNRIACRRQREEEEKSKNNIKVCSHCKEAKPATLEYFYPEKRSISGLHPECKDCTFDRKHKFCSVDERNAYLAACLLTVCLFANTEYRRQYEQAQKEAKLAATREWRTTHKSERRVYRASRSEKNREECRQRRARRKGAAISDFTHVQWVAMQEHYDHRCVYCGKRAKGHLTQDHITPLVEDGNHTASNIVPACRSCNSKKGARAPLVPVQPLLFVAL